MRQPERHLPDHLAVVQHMGTKLFHGAYYRNDPTPSGCDRFLLHTTTTQGYATEREAAEAIEKTYPDMSKIQFPTQ